MAHSWRELLTVRGVIIPPREARATASETDLDRCEGQLGTRLPAAYRRFCTEIGAGSLGEVDVVGPGPVRRGSFRKGDRLIEHVRLARRSLDTMDVGMRGSEAVSFASTRDGDWFLWRLADLAQLDTPVVGAPASSPGNENEVPIHVASPELGQARLCAETFAEFLTEVCLGRRLVDLGIGDGPGCEPMREFLPVR